MRREALLVAVVVALVPASPAAAQEDVDLFKWGVHYFVGTGKHGTGHFSLGPGYNATTLIPFDGCASILARPAKGLGAVDAVGIIDGTNLMEVYFDEFRTPNEQMQVVAPKGVGANVTIDGSEDHEGAVTHPKVFARVAAWGLAHIEVDGYNFTDDGETPKPFWGSFYITNNGFRNNDTQVIETQSGAPYDPKKNGDAKINTNDWEAHLRLEAPVLQPPRPMNVQSRSEGPEGGNVIIYEEEHYRMASFISMAPGGVADLRVAASSRSPDSGAAGTSLRFYVKAPGGQILANFTMEPSLTNQPPAKNLKLPLNQFGRYTIEVFGRAVLAQYSITGSITPPRTFDFNFWWDEVAFGHEGLHESSNCKDELLNNLMPAVMEGVGRNQGPGINLESLVTGAAAAVVGLLLCVKLASDAAMTSKFRSIAKGKR